MKQENFSVSLHYGDEAIGYISFNEGTKELNVVLPEKEWEMIVREYLTSEMTINKATGLSTYEAITLVPTSSLENLKLALTKMWEVTGVQVDWSRPIVSEE